MAGCRRERWQYRFAMPAKKRVPRRSIPPVQRATATRVTSPVTPAERGRSRSSGRAAIVGGGLVVAATLAVYLGTAARDIVFGDSPELIAVAATLGVAHPPGYPLWTVVAHVFSVLPLGPLPLRVGLVSVISGATCAGVVYAIALRLSRSVAAGAAAALIVAVQPVVWQWSIVAEVFALNALLGAIVVYCLLRWSERPASWRWLAAAGFAGGLGLANQQTIVLLAPAGAYLVWRHRRALLREPSMALKAAGALILGLVPYVYLPIAASRDPAWSFGDLSSIGDVVGHVLRSEYGSGQLIVAPTLQGGAISDRLLALGSAIGVLEGTLAIIGLAQLARHRAEVFRFVAIALAFTGPLFVAYANADVTIPLTRAVLERFFVLPYVIAAPLVAPGLQLVAELARRVVPRADPRVAPRGARGPR
jgi:4-amino-4-deoxy-L-arabinose transferase-like glycosyltransferase